jgi:ATP synthase F1 delta subunit
MAELAVAMTYGEALFGAAKDLNKVDEFAKDLKDLESVFESEPDFYTFLSSPSIPAKDKKQVIREVFEGKTETEFINFLNVLIDKCRINAYSQIVKVYDELVSRAEGYSYGRIVSVNPLTPQQLSKFEEETAKLLNVKVHLKNETDPGLIGGVVIYIEGKIIDASVRNRLQTLAGSLM